MQHIKYKRQKTSVVLLCTVFSLTLASCVTKGPGLDPDTLGILDSGTADSSSLTTDSGNTEDSAVDHNTKLDGFSTWSGDGALPSTESLISNLNATLRLNYFNNTPVEAIADGRAEGVTYFLNFTDALGRYRFQSRPECPFEDFYVFKPVTAGESSGPVAIRGEGMVNLGVVLSNPSNIRIAPLTEADAPATASTTCRIPSTETNYEYEGLAMVHNITIGVRLARTPARCTNFCRARGDTSSACTSTCNAATTPLTAQTSFELDNQLRLIPRPSSTQTVYFDTASNTLNVIATLILGF